MSCLRLLVPLALAACAASSVRAEPTVYADVTATHLPAAPELHALDGVFVDVDGDGDLDLALAVEGEVNRLYRNEGDGRFVWVEGAFGTTPHDTEHVRTADFDGDGHADLVFVAEDDQTHQLFLGRGDGTFQDASDRLPGRSEGNGLAVGDVDGDGRPDIVVGSSTGGEGGGQELLWLNDPERPGWFIDATRTHLPQAEDATQDVLLADLDGDGDLDMVVANEAGPPRLLINDGEGRFSDAADRLQPAVALHSREVHALDANGDGRLDLVFFNLTSNNQGWEFDPQTRLLIQGEDGRFVDETAERLPAHRFSSWGGQVVDFDADGHPDLVVSAIAVPGFEPQQVRAWRNDGQGRFTDVTATVIPAETVGRGWSMDAADLNGDGVPDVFVGGWGTQARLLMSGGPTE
ncbi:FG-GAP repeat domain-containing protein [Brevundimonas lutea]|uniref:FG-GAP repeat domain-containing protein n=1 Tax=Brevundimonas lutea TaxID=2293980 RepID=UPI000F0270C2|nr:VCBS repeat-containing protein [Brevundimonas lutea]